VLLVSEAAQHSTKTLAVVYWSWLALLVLSTVLVHQHHLFDGLAGAALALTARRFIR
jgi:membrane-associated phospholipid phosphatase